MQSDVGGVKRYSYTISGGEYITLRNNTSTLFIFFILIYIHLQFLYHGEYISNQSYSFFLTNGRLFGRQGRYLTSVNIRALYCLALLTDSLQRREKLETSMSFLLDGYRDMHIALVIWQLICDPDHLLSKKTESVTCLWSTLATVFLRHICISKFTTALTYFRSVANYLITDSQCRAGICWGEGGSRGMFSRVYQITVLSTCPWTE